MWEPVGREDPLCSGLGDLQLEMVEELQCPEGGVRPWTPQPEEAPMGEPSVSQED